VTHQRVGKHSPTILGLFLGGQLMGGETGFHFLADLVGLGNGGLLGARTENLLTLDHDDEGAAVVTSDV
jgi:hypothetical protein